MGIFEVCLEAFPHLLLLWYGNVILAVLLNE